MERNILPNYRVGDKVCVQDGQCGEVVATTENGDNHGVKLKLNNGDGMSVPTEDLDHATLRIPIEEIVEEMTMRIEVKYPSEIFYNIYNYNNGCSFKTTRYLPNAEAVLKEFEWNLKKDHDNDRDGEILIKRKPLVEIGGDIITPTSEERLMKLDAELKKAIEAWIEKRPKTNYIKY